MNKPKRKLNISLSSMLQSNKLLLIFSLLAAFVLWLWVSIEKSPVIETVITSVPVHIEIEDSIPSQMGLKIFGNTNYTVDVTVSGKKFIVSSLTADDIKVVAQTNYVDSAGNKTLTLKPVNDTSKEFDIISLSQNYISVYFDFYKEAEFALTPNVTSDVEKTVTDGCFLGEPILSRTTVSVSGPSTEINKITGVNANYTVTSTLEATTTVTPEIELFGATPDQLSNTAINAGDNVITMSLPVLKEVMLPTSVTFRNVPLAYISQNISYSVSPSSVRVGVPVEQLEQTTEISVGTIDFSEIDAGNNSFNFSSDAVTDFSVMSKVSSFKVNVNMSNCTSKVISIPVSAITVSKQNEGFDCSVISKDNLNIKVIGPADALSSLNESSIKAELDLSAAELTQGSNTVPVTVSLNTSHSSCWVYSEYSVTVNAVTK